MPGLLIAEFLTLITWCVIAWCSPTIGVQVAFPVLPWAHGFLCVCVCVCVGPRVCVLSACVFSPLVQFSRFSFYLSVDPSVVVCCALRLVASLVLSLAIPARGH